MKAERSTLLNSQSSIYAMSSLPPSSLSAAPSLAFVSSPPAALVWQAAQVVSKKQPVFFSTTPLKSFADGNYESAAEDSETSLSISSESNSENDSDDDASNIKPVSSAVPNMGASIGAQNVGEMLFNEQLLKSGRGDVRVGHIGRWKDFRGNEIVPDDTADGPN